MQTAPRVLILEDNATTRMVISKSLEEQGVDVVVACTLAEAEQHLQDDSIDLYLLDVNLRMGTQRLFCRRYACFIQWCLCLL